MATLILRPRLLIGTALLLMAGLSIVRVSQTLPDLQERAEYQVETHAIQVNPPPRWAPPDLAADLVRRSVLEETVCVLDEDVTERVAAAFLAHPWVAEVQSVRKTVRPARVELTLLYREPAAMVAVATGLYPVTSSGVLLPPSDFAPADIERLPRIDGVLSVPEGGAGEPWGDPTVIGAARLAVILAPVWEKLDLQAIRAPRPTRETNNSLEGLIYQLVTVGGSRIVWGRAPGVTHPGELTPEQKLGRLEKYLIDFDSFDRPHGPYEIDIRHWREISRRRLPDAVIR